MGNTAVPTLTSDGWVTAVDKKCDRLLMNAFASDASQSNMFAGSVTSIQGIIYDHSDDPSAAGTVIASRLQQMYARHFDAASFRADVNEWVDKSGRYDIAITGTVVQENRKYDFGRMVESSNGIVVKMMTSTGVVLWANETLNQ